MIRVELEGTHPDKRAINAIIAANNVKIVKTKSKAVDVIWTIEVETDEQVNNLLVELNNKTRYGVCLTRRWCKASRE